MHDHEDNTIIIHQVMLLLIKARTPWKHLLNWKKKTHKGPG